jgi:hypothetical protein
MAHAAIDLDALGLAHLPFLPSNGDVMYRNLQFVCKKPFFARWATIPGGARDERPQRSGTLSWRCFSN